MWKISGQNKIIDALQRSLENGYLAHAYLFIGPEHVGKMTLAINLAQALNCQSEDKPCGQCMICNRIAVGNHPDIHFIGRDGSAESGRSSPRKEIGIEQIRELQHSIYLKPYEGDYRVIIINGVEYMSEEASNSLLKTLEEPPPNTIFILLTASEISILPTILSRCQMLELKPMPIPEIRQILVKQKQVPDERAELISRLSDGCLGWAISAIDNQSLLEKREQNLSQFLSLTDGDISERFEFASQLGTLFGKSRVQVNERLELWLSWWRDLLLIKGGCPQSITNIDREDTLRQLTTQYSLDKITQMIKAIQQATQQLDQNANPRLTLEVLMLNIPFGEKEGSYA